MSVILKWDEEEQESNPPHGTGGKRTLFRLGNWRKLEGGVWPRLVPRQRNTSAWSSLTTLLQEPAAMPVFQEPDQAP